MSAEINMRASITIGNLFTFDTVITSSLKTILSDKNAAVKE